MRVVAHLVTEEENGGNGSLAMARRGETADACIVFEPTAGRIFTSIRGAVWFRIHFRGTAGHSGEAGRTRSALLMARHAIAALERYHARLLEASRGIPLFDVYENPMPITFGRLSAGNWPAAAPSTALLEGVMGFLPNRTKEQVMDEFREALVRDAGLAPEDFDLAFTYRHDCSVVDPSHRLPRGLAAAASAMGGAPSIAAFPASCDAWFYNNILGVPTVVYGPGDLAHANSKDEQIRVDSIAEVAATIVRFILESGSGLSPTHGDRSSDGGVR
jgi:acetylornithine deacetylase